MSGTAPTVVQACDVRAPSGASAPTARQRLAGTGGTGVENATPLTVGEMGTLLNESSIAIRVAFGSVGSVEAAVTDMVIGPYGRFDWLVSPLDKYVSVQAADATSAFEAGVWTSSGARATT